MKFKFYFFLLVAVSTFESGFSGIGVCKTVPRPRKLPPVADGKETLNRKLKFKAETQQKERFNCVKVRTSETNVCTSRATDVSRRKDFLPLLGNTSFQSTRRNTQQIVAMNEREALLFKRLKGIYSNSVYKSLRAQRIQNSIISLQSRALHSEIQCSLKEYKKNVEKDKRIRSELKRVRDKHSKDRKRRNMYSYMSLNALECPQVSRQAYGLPGEGEELKKSVVTQTSQKQLLGIWKKATKRAAIVSKMIPLRPEKQVSSLEIKIRSKPRRTKGNTQGMKYNGDDQHEICNLPV